MLSQSQGVSHRDTDEDEGPAAAADQGPDYLHLASPALLLHHLLCDRHLKSI